MNRVYLNLMMDNPDASYESHEAAEETVLDDPDLFAYGPEMLFRHNKNLAAVKNFEDITRNVIGLGLAKDSEFTHCFNHHLARMKESGVIWTLLEKSHLMEKKDEKSEEDHKESQPLGYDNLMLPMFIIGVGSCFAILIVWIERVKA